MNIRGSAGERAAGPPPRGPVLLRLGLAGVPALAGEDGAERQPLDAHGALIAARLALAGPQPRAELARRLWPDAEDARARGNLRQRLLRLKALAGGVEWIAGDSVLALAPGVLLEPLQPALDQGDPPGLLHGLPEPADEELATWLAAERQAWRSERVRRLHEAAAEAETDGRGHEALPLLLRAVALEPQSELHRRLLVRQHYLLGDTTAAESAWRELARMLEQEFGAAPGAESLALLELVRRGHAGRAAPARPLAVPVALSRPPRLIGRETERQALHRAVREGRVMWIVGEAGMGKSRLLAEVLADLVDLTAAADGSPQPAGAPLLTKARPGDAGVPYSTLARVLRQRVHTLRDAVPSGGALARLLPELSHAAPAPRPAEADRLALQQAVLALFETGPPAWIALDDLHFADEASIEMLHALLASEAFAHRPCLLTQRPGESGEAARRMVDALSEAQRLEPLSLAPLTDAQMEQLVASLGLSGLDAAEWGRRLARHCGGNPLFALETIKAVLAQPAPAQPAEATLRMPSPAPVRVLIERRLRQLGERALALARLAAIAGPDLSPALAEHVLGRPAVELSDPWAELEAAQVLREQAFAHDLVLEVTLGGIPAPIARHLHAAVAAWLEAHDGEPARVAGHWLSAGRELESLPWLVRAGARAEEVLRAADAAAFFDRAAALATRHAALPAGIDAHDLHFRAAGAHGVAGQIEQERAAFEQALVLASTLAQRVETLNRLVLNAQDRGDFERAIELGQQALAESTAASDERCTCDAALLHASSLSKIGEYAEAEALLERHWAACQRAMPGHWKPAAARAMVLDNLGRIAEAHAFHEQALERTLGLEAADQLVHLGNHAINRIDAGDLGHAAELLARAAAIEAAHSDVPAGSQARLRALVARDRGQFALAFAEFERALAIDGHGTEPYRKLLHVNRAWTWIVIGQWARALKDLAAAGALDAMPPWVHGRAEWLRAAIAAGLGKPLAPVEWPPQEQLIPSVHYAIEFHRAALSACTPEGAAAALECCRAIETETLERGMLGTAWAARWRGAAFALACGAREQAAAWAVACLERDTAITPAELQMGTWWHGLWTLLRELGDEARAAAARAEGVAWIHRTLQRELPAEFHAAFKEVPEHQALLRG